MLVVQGCAEHEYDAHLEHLVYNVSKHLHFFIVTVQLQEATDINQ